MSRRGASARKRSSHGCGSSPLTARRIAGIRPQPFAFEAGHRRALGALPSPTKPRPAGVWSLQDLPEAGKPAAGWGGVGGGGPSASYRTTPTPAQRADPPHKGEGRTEYAALHPKRDHRSRAAFLSLAGSVAGASSS